MIGLDWMLEAEVLSSRVLALTIFPAPIPRGQPSVGS